MILTYREFQRTHHDEMLREFDGVGDTLALLKSRGHPMALVTSKSNDLAHRALAWLHLTDHIDVVVGMDSTERHKPDPEPVRFALAALGAEPAQRALPRRLPARYRRRQRRGSYERRGTLGTLLSYGAGTGASDLASSSTSVSSRR